LSQKRKEIAEQGLDVQTLERSRNAAKAQASALLYDFGREAGVLSVEEVEAANNFERIH
jgi:hypothetical protein